LYDALSVVTVTSPVFPDVTLVGFALVPFKRAGEAKTGTIPMEQTRIASNANPLKRVLILVESDFFCYLKLRKKLLTKDANFGTLPIRYILTSRWMHLSLWISHTFTANVQRRF
jgi:hypothetical protein